MQFDWLLQKTECLILNLNSKAPEKKQKKDLLSFRLRFLNVFTKLLVKKANFFNSQKIFMCASDTQFLKLIKIVFFGIETTTEQEFKVKKDWLNKSKKKNLF